MQVPYAYEAVDPRREAKLKMMTDAKLGISPKGGTGRLMSKEKAAKNRKNRKKK